MFDGIETSFKLAFGLAICLALVAGALLGVAIMWGL